MVSLVDIGPLTEKVSYRGKDIEVHGLTAQTIFLLLQDIPELRKLMAERALDGNDIESLVLQFPQVVATCIISAIGGDVKNEAEINAVLRMTAGEQLMFLSAVFKLTFPQGVQNFVESLLALVPNQGVRGWDQAMKSQNPSSDASKTATDSTTAGNTPQGS